MTDRPDPFDIQTEAVADAYYSRAFNAPDTIRSRAQTGFNLATLIASGLLAAGVFANLQNSTAHFRYGAMVVVGLWIAAIALSVLAATRPFNDPSEGKTIESTADWVKHVAEQSLAERNDILRWQRFATWTSVGALAATLALVGWWMLSPSIGRVASRLALNTPGVTAYYQACGVKLKNFTISVERDSLTSEELVLFPSSTECHGSKRTVRIPRGDVQSIATG
jgi:hypothetical protein